MSSKMLQYGKTSGMDWIRDPITIGMAMDEAYDDRQRMPQIAVVTFIRSPMNAMRHGLTAE